MTGVMISKTEARSFLVRYHGLCDSKSIQGEEEILEYFRKVGCIQYDPLNMVGRNPDLVLQSRIENYSKSILDKLLYTDRKLIDGWDKMMAIYRSEEWPHFNRLRIRKEESTKCTMRKRDTLEALKLTEEVTDIVKKNGPLLATQISIGAAGSGKWGHRKLSSVTLDYLYTVGVLGVFKKKNTQKIYDLIENLLPDNILNTTDPFNNDREFYKWYFKRRIGSVGMLWARNGGGWLGHFLSDKKLRSSILTELVEENSIIPVSVQGIDDNFYIRVEDIELLMSKETEKPTMRFLAPLDNMLWDRDMVKRIFDFEYSWEVYVPKAKRKYGYYVLPVLYGDRIVARFEPEKQRGKEPLVIKNWWWEEGIEVTKDMELAVDECVKKFNDYLHTANLN